MEELVPLWKPELRHLLDLLRVLGCQIVRLGSVSGQVEEFPIERLKGVKPLWTGLLHLRGLTPLFKGPLQARWLDVNRSTWQELQTVARGGTQELKTFGKGHWRC